MRKIFLITTALFSFVVAAQDPEIKTDMPVIMGPSPTVASLMKFEEVPVNNYSGIPNISIPLFKSNTHSKDINLNISLDYHIANAAVNRRSSDVGTGWTLMAGGTIARSVRGLPDEYWKGSGNTSKRGVYQDSLASGVANTFYNAFEILNDTLGANQFDTNEFLWNAQVRGMFDTEHDLWQFNFMGFSGRFYIKKDSTGALVVKPLDDYRLKIINHYYNGPTNTTNTKYTPTSFDIFDDKGYKYVFDVIEETRATSTTVTIGITEFGNPGNVVGSPETKYISALHLSKVYDTQGNLLLNFIYDHPTITESEWDLNVTKTMEKIPGNLHYYMFETGCADKVNFNPPYGTVSVKSIRSTHAKKLSRIEVTDFAKIDFKFEAGREDLDLVDADSAYAFKGIVIRDWAGDSIRKVDLAQSYNLGSGKMTFSEVRFGNFINEKKETYVINYYGEGDDYTAPVWDQWGYVQTPEGEFISEGSYRDYKVKGLIKKMILPTGGCVLYQFEPNTYSFIGDTALTDFTNNPGNWQQHIVPKAFTVFSGSPISFFTIDNPYGVTFDVQVNTGSGNPVVDKWKFTIKKIGSSFTKTIGKDPTMFFGEDDPCEDGECSLSALMEAGSYEVSFTSPDSGDFNPGWSASIIATYTTPVATENTKSYLMGAGNRIKRISWFEDGNIDADDYFLYSDATPSKEKNYDYNLFDNSGKSSGSLICKPEFSYEKSKKECYWCVNEGLTLGEAEPDFNYKVNTEFSNLISLKTQGVDVGYRNVKVYETGNGRTEYTYTSAYEEPVDIQDFNLRPPFTPLINKDYRRGLLKKEVVFNQAGDTLRTVKMDYDFDEHLERTGFRLYYPEEFVRGTYAPMLYSLYMGYIDGCDQTCFCYFGQPYEFIHWEFIDEAYGWAKLTSKITKEYFYEGTNEKIVQTNEEFDYNDTNKQLAWHTTTGSEGEILKTEYFYHTGNSDVSQNRISEIEEIKTYRDSELLSRSKIIYGNTHGSNHPWLPAHIQSAKGSGTLESRVHFSKYDDFGNPLEMQQAGGPVISYIWGYNDTKSVAKIENMHYNNIPGALVAVIKSKADAYNNIGLLEKLDLLRIDSALEDAMMTGYSYKPLVGIETIIDPKGQAKTYEYDEFGRLVIVRDDDGTILTENQYNYRTQQP